ncbi:hypothetical protein V1525DRAFT_435367 [Lipomyces kononenkoae]|uniref:Uncharacterized protein n=1 Tax=Lipomyces kononenkoae TaxID=34357 RepID=A0ACC3SST9_LIPKO
MSLGPNTNSDSDRRESSTVPKVSSNNMESFNLRDDLRVLEDNLGLHRGGADSPLCGARAHYSLDPRALKRALLNHIERHGDNNEHYIDNDDRINEDYFADINNLARAPAANDTRPSTGTRLYNWTKRTVSKIRENICMGRSSTPEYEMEQHFGSHNHWSTDTVRLVDRRVPPRRMWSLNGIISVERSSADLRNGYSRKARETILW